MKTRCILIFLLISNTLFGQDKGFNFGFNFGVIQRVDLITLNDNNSFDKIQNSNRLGFDLGLSFYYIFNSRLELRTAPSIGFEEEEMVYILSGSSETMLFGPAFAKLPTHSIIKISNKLPIGILLGVTPSIQIGQLPNAPTDKLEFKKYDFSADIGINLPINLPWFDVFPEIRYSRSLINCAGDNRTEYGQAISGFNRNKFVFTLHFR